MKWCCLFQGNKHVPTMNENAQFYASLLFDSINIFDKLQNMIRDQFRQLFRVNAFQMCTLIALRFYRYLLHHFLCRLHIIVIQMIIVVKPFFFCFEIKQTQNMSVFSLCLFLHCTIQQLDSMVPFKCLLTMLCNRLLKAANEIEWEK